LSMMDSATSGGPKSVALGYGSSSSQSSSPVPKAQFSTPEDVARLFGDFFLKVRHVVQGSINIYHSG